MTEERQHRHWHGWLVYDEVRAAVNKSYIQMHHEVGANYGIQFELLMPWQAESRIGQDEADFPDFAIVRTIRPDLSERMEQAGIPVFNPSSVSYICNDKGRTISYIQEHTSVPVIPTWRFCRSELTESLLRDYPKSVIKAVDGHGGTQVFRTSNSFAELVRGIGDSDFVIQPFMEGKGEDVRVYVIGTERIGAIKRTASDGFRSNFSLGGSVCPCVLGRREIRFVEELCELFDFGMVGIDFIVDQEGKYWLNEIEDVVGARMLYQCWPGIGLLERYFAFILDKLLHYT